jgi:hypothetical protein
MTGGLSSVVSTLHIAVNYPGVQRCQIDDNRAPLIDKCHHCEVIGVRGLIVDYVKVVCHNVV